MRKVNKNTNFNRIKSNKGGQLEISNSKIIKLKINLSRKLGLKAVMQLRRWGL